MKIGFIAENRTNENGFISGGSVVGTGITIVWQNGPLGRDEDRVSPNGAFVEDVIDAAKQRIEAYQAGPHACEDNAIALNYLNLALDALDNRTRSREARQVEGTHKL